MIDDVRGIIKSSPSALSSEVCKLGLKYLNGFQQACFFSASLLADESAGLPWSKKHLIAAVNKRVSLDDNRLNFHRAAKKCAIRWRPKPFTIPNIQSALWTSVVSDHIKSSPSIKWT